MRIAFVILLALAAGTGCHDGGGADMAVTCTPSAVDACEQQCAPGISGGICYPDPICGSDGRWVCFCQPCRPQDLAVQRD